MVERIPAVCGVYAWFRNAEVVDTGDGETYYKALIQRASHTYGVPRESFLGPSIEISLTPRTDISGRELPQLRAACDNAKFRAWMTTALSSISTFLPPLYVGATINLRSRIGTHLKPGSPLRTRFDGAGIRLEEITLRYVMLPELGHDSVGLDKEVEAIMANILIPGFSVRYG